MPATERHPLFRDPLRPEIRAMASTMLFRGDPAEPDDFHDSRVRWLIQLWGAIAFIAMGVASCATLYFASSERWALALTVFVIGNVAVTSSLAFYNALLPGIARRDEVDRVSTAGFAMGYLGGGALLAANLAMISSPQRFGIADVDTPIRLSFVSVAVWWALFSLPLLRRVKEPMARAEPGEDASRGLLRVALGRLRETFRELRQHK